MDKCSWSFSPALEQIRKWAGVNGIQLYIVGGWVRDSLLGLPAWDADLSGPLHPEALKPFLPGDCSVTMTLRDAGLGTVELHALGETFEYTAFRRESYRPGGAHRPNRVELGATLQEDALRRDFTVNAIYLDLKTLELIDPRGGLQDLGRRQLSTTRDPESVLNEDGLRLLRLIRQSAELEFTPTDAVRKAALSHIRLLKDIAPERLRDELFRILTADLRHPEKNYSKNPVIAALSGMAEYGVWNVLCPEAERYASDPGLIRAVSRLGADPSLRLCALWHPLPVSLLKEACSELKLTKKESQTILQLAPLVSIPLDRREFSLLCASLGREKARSLVSVRACLSEEGFSPADPEEKHLLDDMILRQVPFSLKELDLTGRDLIPLFGGPSEHIGSVLDTLWKHTVLHPEDNRHEVLIRLARETELEC